MSATDSDISQSDLTPTEELDAPVSDPPDDQDADEAPENDPQVPPSPRPLRIYTRGQLLDLLKSPLVALPPNMPELKDWFGCVANCCLSIVLLMGTWPVSKMNKI